MSFGLVTREKNGQKKPTRYYSSKQEKSVAQATGGKQTSNSGATNFGGKGDVLLPGHSFLIECKTKTTPSDSISIRKEWIEKNAQEAAFEGKAYSAIAFNFGPGERSYYIIDEFLFQDLLEYKKNN